MSLHTVVSRVYYSVYQIAATTLYTGVYVHMACIEIVKAINTFTYFFLTDSVDEWKKQLAVYLIDYDSLDIKEIKASG